MKAVLVIDVEERDIGRKVNYISVQGGGMSYIVGSMGNDVRLRPLPKIKTREEEIAKDPFIDDLFYDEFILGYNTCLNEIAGGTE